MDKERFQKLMARPDIIEDEDIAKLHQVVRDYPGFHNAHYLLLYGLYKQNSEKFDNQLNHSALFLSNRAFLMNAIFNGHVSLNRVGAGIVTEIQELKPEENLPTGKADILQEETPAIIENETAPMNVADFEAETAEKIAVSEIEQVQEVLPESSPNDTFTFSLEDSQPIETFEKKEMEVPVKQDLVPDLLELDMSTPKADDEQTGDLIDHFLKVNPRIVPKLDLEDSRGDISQPGLEENDEIVTETLASIFEQQGHFQKAKDAFQKLILKFPEKSTYFASRIQELEKRIK